MPPALVDAYAEHMAGARNPNHPTPANAPTVLVELDTVVTVGPQPGPGNSDGGLSDWPSTEPPAGSMANGFEVPVPVLLHISAEPGPGDSDGGGYDLATDS